MQTVKTLIRRCRMWKLIWICTAYLCSTQRMLGLWIKLTLSLLAATCCLLNLCNQFWPRSGPEVIKLFSCSTQLSTKFILFINVKMPTIVGILTFISMINTTSERLKARYFFTFRHFSSYEQLKFLAQLTWAQKKFYNPTARTRSWSGSKPFDALIVFLKEFFFIWRKKVSRWQQKHEKLPSLQRVTVTIWINLLYRAMCSDKLLFNFSVYWLLRWRVWEES